MVRVQKQLFRHDPDNGIYGDCHRTAYACLLGVPPETIPHFAEGGNSDFNKREKHWLNENGFDIIAIVYPGETPLSDVLSTLAHINPGIPFILGGTSGNGCGHSVVCLDGEIVCDPSIDGSGVQGPMSDGYWWATYLVKIPASTKDTPHD